MLDKHSDPAKVALAAVGAIPFCVRKRKPMFARLKRILFWTVATFLVLIVFALGGYAIGMTDGYSVGRCNGLVEGVNYTLTQAQKHGAGLWVAEPGPNGQPANKFVWLDDLAKKLEGKTQHDSDPFNFNPLAPKEDDGIKQIGQPDRGASIARPRVTLCASGGAIMLLLNKEPAKTVEPHDSGNATGGTIQLLPNLLTENKETGITTIHSEDPCDPLNFVYFVLFLGIVAGGSALLAMGVHRIHVYRKSRIAH